MLDIKFIRKHPEVVQEGCRKKNVDCNIEQILELDKQTREIKQQIEELRAEQKKASGPEETNIETAKKIKAKIKVLEPKLEEISGGLQAQLMLLPNIPQDNVPVGEDESANVVLRQWGNPPTGGFKPKDHVQLGEALDIIDIERAAKVSGARFAYLKNEGAILEFALVEFIMRLAVQKGFTPIIPPVFVKEESMQAMGYVDTIDDLAERYFFPGRTEEKGGMFLVGTAEQSVGPMHMGEVLDEKDLPRRYVAFSTCFREEAGSYGKDTKGILRVHQFDKVELFSFCHPEKSKEEHEFLVEFEESLWQALGIPYQVVQLSTGDMSRPATTTIDIEAWLPGQGKYREVSSASNITDFQARRLNIRYKGADNKLNFVHMLNATGFPIGRTVIAILENYQQENGSVQIPEVLQEFVGKAEIKRPGI